MVLLQIMVCFSALLQSSLLTPILAAKPKPVNLEITCMTINDTKQQNSIHEDVPVILLHGLTGTKEIWRGIFEILALDTKRKVCAADLRNHGQSPWNDEEYDVAAMTEDVRHLMDRIKASKAIILGHSLGGKIAVHLSLNYPERVEKVIVEDMRPNGINPPALVGAEFYAHVLKKLEKDIPQDVSEKEAKENFLRLLKEQYAKINVALEVEDPIYMPVKCSEGKCQLSVNTVLLDALLRNPTSLLPESSGYFNGPALFIYGTESLQKVGEDESNIKKLFPHAELVAVEGAGHVVHASKKFLTEVIKFINSKRE